MKKNDVLSALKAKPENGWELIPFTDKKTESFYTWILENHDLPIAWIAVVKRINRKQIHKHFFKRKNIFKGESAPGQPRLLMVTSGTSWLVADMEMESFSYFEPLCLEGLLAAEIKLFIENQATVHLNYLQQEAFKAFLDDYLLRVNKNWDEVTYKREFAFLDNMGLDLKVPRETENKLDVLELKNKVNEYYLHDAKTELFDNSIIFHYLLANCLRTQRNKVLELASRVCYVNLWYKPGESILIKNKISNDNETRMEYYEIFVNGKDVLRSSIIEESGDDKARMFFRFNRDHFQLARGNAFR